MLISFSTAIKGCYGDFILKWWRGKEHFIKTWVHELRNRHIMGDLMFYPFHFTFNGAGFRNDSNTKWLDGWQIAEIILYAPVLRREILPSELVLEPDIEDKGQLIRKSCWLQAAIEAYNVDYTVGYSGNRSFHFHIIVDPSTKLPSELPEGFNLNLFREALFNLIGYTAGFEGLDEGTAGFKAKRHAIREFFSINHKTQTYKVPVEDIEIHQIKFPKPVKIENWRGYRLWKPSKSQIEEILEECERILEIRQKSQKKLVGLWRAKPRKRRTIAARWRLERIQKYAEALKLHGRLTADSEIAKRHANEHYARLHLLFLMLEEDFPDEQIHEVFSHAEDYRREKTQYFIDYNRNRLDQTEKQTEGG